MKLALLIFASSALIGGAELLKRRFSLPASITRRVIHVGTAAVAGVAPLFVTKEQIVIVSLVFLVVLAAGRASALFSAIHAVERKTFGELYLPLGVALTAMLSLPHDLMAFQFGIFVMAVSDSLAGLVGEKFGRHPITLFGHTKTLEGSLIFFLCTLVLAFLFFPVIGYQIILVAVVLTLIEFSMIYGLDNAVLPVIGSVLVQMIF